MLVGQRIWTPSKALAALLLLSGAAHAQQVPGASQPRPNLGGGYTSQVPMDQDHSPRGLGPRTIQAPFGGQRTELPPTSPSLTRADALARLPDLIRVEGDMLLLVNLNTGAFNLSLRDGQNLRALTIPAQSSLVVRCLACAGRQAEILYHDALAPASVVVSLGGALLVSWSAQDRRFRVTSVH